MDLLLTAGGVAAFIVVVFFAATMLHGESYHPWDRLDAD